MGGAGGHMWHPFDCPDVNSGQDLIDFFENSIEWAKTNKPSLKIDGVNLSFRVIENRGMPAGYEFAVDRGSQEELDRAGVTADTASQRFVSKDPFEPEENEDGEFECPEDAEVIYVGEDKKMMCLKEHGMIAATKILTDIFNDALPDIMPELEQLGMLENIGPYSNYFNTEFVLKKINVKEYAFDFIAIHSVNDFEPNKYPDDHETLAGQIRWKKNKDIQVDGVGDTNPDSHEEGDSVPGHVGYLWRWDPLAGWAASIPGSKVGKEIKYDQTVLNRLKDKVKPHALKKEFRVYTNIPTDTVRDVILKKALNQEFTVVYSSQMRDPEEPGEMGIGEGSTKTIEAWLSVISRNPFKTPILISDAMIEKYPKMNKRQLAMAKNIYIEVLKGTAINEIIDSPEFTEPVVDGVVFWHATRVLGNAVLDSLESDEFGSANEQEGVVIKDENICGGTRFKFTGDFIVGGLASTFEEQKFRTGKLLESFAYEATSVSEQLSPRLSPYEKMMQNIEDEGGKQSSVTDFMVKKPDQKKSKKSFLDMPIRPYAHKTGGDPQRNRLISLGLMKGKKDKGYEFGIRGEFDESVNSDDNVITEEEQSKYVILIPGGFKPPTGGHYSMIKQYEEKPDVAKVFVVTGPKPREGVTLQQSKQIFDIYGGFSDKVEFVPSNDPTPLLTCYELMQDKNFTSKFPGVSFSIGAGNKGKDPKRIQEFVNYFNSRPGLTDAEVAAYTPAEALTVDGKPASASRLRAAFKNGDWEEFKKLLPNEARYEDVVQALEGQGDQPGGKEEENFLAMESLFSLVDSIINENKEPNNIEEELIGQETPEFDTGEQANQGAPPVDADQQAEAEVDRIKDNLGILLKNAIGSLTISPEQLEELGPEIVDVITGMLTAGVEQTLQDKEAAMQDKESLEEISTVSSISGYQARPEDTEESIIRR